MIMYFNKIQHKKIFIIVYVNKWYRILLKDSTLQYLHMDKLVVVRHTQCLEIYMVIKKTIKE